ncbi:MAG: hypothetical protein PVI30_14125 [Myxococcales bacterium]
MRKLLATGLALGLPLTALGGCAGARVESGAAIGAATGAALGGGVGVLITDDKLLGSPATDSTGDTSIPTDGGILASVAVGAVVGAIVGAMVGHRRDEGYDDIVLPEDQKIDPSLLPEADGSGETEASAPNPQVSF